MTTKRTVFKKGEKRFVHVVAKTLKENLDTGKEKPMIGVRLARDPNETHTFNRLVIQGPSILIPRPKRPLPCTDGRAICYLITSAKMIGYLDL